MVSSSVNGSENVSTEELNFFSVYEVSSFLISGYTIFSVWKNCKWKKLGFFCPFTENESRRPGQLFVLLLISGHILLYSLA